MLRVAACFGVAARLAGPASNFASHGGPSNEERLENVVSGKTVELLMKPDSIAFLRWHGTLGHEDTVAKSSCVSIKARRFLLTRATQ